LRDDVAWLPNQRESGRLTTSPTVGLLRVACLYGNTG
jgi:hypothetical protein